MENEYLCIMLNEFNLIIKDGEVIKCKPKTDGPLGKSTCVIEGNSIIVNNGFSHDYVAKVLSESSENSLYKLEYMRNNNEKLFELFVYLNIAMRLVEKGKDKEDDCVNLLVSFKGIEDKMLYTIPKEEAFAIAKILLSIPVTNMRVTLQRL